MPSATDRGLREYLARYKEQWEIWKAETGKEWFDWKKFEADARRERHFSPLSDDEWQCVLAELARAGIEHSDEKTVRKRIDVATLASGYFSGFGIAHLPQPHKVREAQTGNLRIATSLEALLPAIISYLGDPPSGFGDDNYDPHEGFRGIEEALAEFIRHIKRRASDEMARLKDYPPPRPNAKRKPETDRWGASLIEVWGKTLNQPVVNCIALQRFLIACASPYGWLAYSTPETAERQARYFIGSYLRQEVKPYSPVDWLE